MGLSEKKVLFIIPNKSFRDEEFLEPRRILESNKVKTSIASKSLDFCSGMLGAKVTPNLTLDKIIINDYDAIIFVGGSGSNIYWNDKLALSIAKESYLKGKIVGSICLASGTLANAGLFKGKKATGWEDTKELIEKNGGLYTGKDIEVDGRLISAVGPKAARIFGEEIVKALKHEFED